MNRGTGRSSLRRSRAGSLSGKILLVVACASIAAAGWLLWPLPALRSARQHPAADYAEAAARVGRLAARDTMALHEGCATVALLHGHRTARAIVLIHGLTNCPLQFAALAGTLFAAGDNVIAPRVDHHGLADRMTEDLARLTAGEMATLVRECVDIARGLGDTVVVAGLSSGGVMTAWAAQTLDGVDRAIVIAPLFGPPWGRSWTVPWVTRIALRLPNRFEWWDSRKKEALPGPAQCYPRFSTHAIAETFRLGGAALASLRREPPRAREIDVVTTEADEAIDLPEVQRVTNRWRSRGTRVRRTSFPRAMNVTHDMIDPAQVGARTDVVYPVLIALVHGGTVPAPFEARP